MDASALHQATEHHPGNGSMANAEGKQDIQDTGSLYNSLFSQGH